MHVHVDAPFDKVLMWAKAGKLSGVTVINDTGWANELAQYVKYVVLRMVQSDHDNPTQDYQRYGADPRVIIQCGNEANLPHDTDHWLKQMHDAEADGRKVVIFNDSVGATEDAQWLERLPALIQARDHGHYIGLHAYGDVTKGGSIYCPMIDPAQPDAYRWFFGRFEHLYNLIPDVQPPLILTEAGAGGFQQNATREQWLADIQRVEGRMSNLPYVKSFNLWTAGGHGSLGFDRDSLDNWL